MDLSVATFLGKITSLAIKYPLSVTSWIRSPLRNITIGGHEFSLHMLALAVDIVLDDMGRKKDFIKDCRRIGLIAVDEGDHIHVQIPQP